MPKARSTFGVIGALLPVGYCAGLIFYFLNKSSSLETANEIGLGPTIMGLGLVGLLVCLPLFWNLFRMFSGPASPDSGAGGAQKGPAASGKGKLDADAIIARYLAQRPVEPVPTGPALGARAAGATMGRPTFGRRGR